MTVAENRGMNACLLRASEGYFITRRHPEDRFGKMQEAVQEFFWFSESGGISLTILNPPTCIDADSAKVSHMCWSTAFLWNWSFHASADSGTLLKIKSFLQARFCDVIAGYEIDFLKDAAGLQCSAVHWRSTGLARGVTNFTPQ